MRGSLRCLGGSAKAGKLGDRTTPPPEDPARCPDDDLARALSTTPVSADWSPLDGAALPVPAGQRRRRRGGPAPRFAAKSPQSPVRAPQPGASGGCRGAGSTFKEIRLSSRSDERSKSGERSQEVEACVPPRAFMSQSRPLKDDPCQVSALVVAWTQGRSIPDTRFRTGGQDGPADGISPAARPRFVAWGVR